jgi:hypothetical protein
MAYLKEFSKEDADLLVALPYRVGLWVSSSDNTGGGDADEKELEALQQTITGIVHGMFESAFVHEVMAETFLRRDEWRGWGMNLRDIPGECKNAVALIQGKLPQRDVDAYKRILMHIGVEVAKAFREYDSSEPLLSRVIRMISIGIDRLLGTIHGEKYVSSQLLNISYEEDLALNTLAQALRGEVNEISEKTRIITHS